MEFGKKEQEIVINIKDHIKMIKKMVMEYLHGQLGIFIRVIMNKIIEISMVRCFGVMVHFIKENGKMESNMVRVNYMFQKKDLKEVFLQIIL